MASGCSGGWRVTAIAKTTPTAPTASTNAAISTVRGGPSLLSIVLTLPGVVTYPPGGGVSTLGDIGEFGVIEGLIRGRRQPGAVAVGPGDDAAVLLAADGRVVVSTDMLVENRHFRLDWSTPHDVGRKAVAQNAADIEAMGA